jgi:hypothetical protein
VTVQKIKEQLRPGKHVKRDIAAVEQAELSSAGWRYFSASPLDERFILRDTILSLAIDKHNPMMFLTAKVGEWSAKNFSDTLANQWLANFENVEIPFDAARRRSLEKNLSVESQTALQIRRQKRTKKNRANITG